MNSVFLDPYANVALNLAHLSEGINSSKERNILVKAAKKAGCGCTPKTFLVVSNSAAFALGSALHIPTLGGIVLLGSLTFWGWRWLEKKGEQYAAERKICLIYCDVIAHINSKTEEKKSALLLGFNRLPNPDRLTPKDAKEALDKLETTYNASAPEKIFRGQLAKLENSPILEEVQNIGIGLIPARDIRKELQRACGLYLVGKTPVSGTYLSLKETPEGVVALSD